MSEQLTDQELEAIKANAIARRTRIMMASNYGAADPYEWQRVHDEIRLVKEVQRLRAEAKKRRRS